MEFRVLWFRWCLGFGGFRWGLEFGGLGGVQDWGSIGLKVQGLG